MGRPRKLTAEQEQEASNSYIAGASVRSLAEDYDVSASCIYDAFERTGTTLRGRSNDGVTRAEVKRLSKAGKTPREIKSELKITLKTVYWHLNSCGILAYRFRNEAVMAKHKKIHAMRAKKMSIKEIADFLEISKSNVNYHLQDYEDPCLTKR